MLIVKTVHAVSALISISGFIVRGVWMLRESPLLHRRWVKIAPHIVDTVLLISAIVLAVQIAQYPFVNGWLTAKVIGLLLYIILGTLAIKRGKTKSVKTLAFFSAIIVFIYIVLVAITKNPLLLT